jgi:hypothetical protein
MKRHNHIEGHHVESSAWQVQQADAEDSSPLRMRCQRFRGFF